MHIIPNKKNRNSTKPGCNSDCFIFSTQSTAFWSLRTSSWRGHWTHNGWNYKTHIVLQMDTEHHWQATLLVKKYFQIITEYVTKFMHAVFTI